MLSSNNQSSQAWPETEWSANRNAGHQQEVEHHGLHLLSGAADQLAPLTELGARLETEIGTGSGTMEYISPGDDYNLFLDGLDMSSYLLPPTIVRISLLSLVQPFALAGICMCVQHLTQLMTALYSH